jgi:peptidoglycan lytic transglycosylase
VTARAWTGTLALALTTAAALPACAHHYHYSFPPTETPPAGLVETGIASWYGPGYHGKKTSSGERYDQDSLTAAHASWAFGTLVRVTFLGTGRSVVVRINDRFPNYKGRVIDLSREAARQIGLIGPGTGMVRLEVLG